MSARPLYQVLPDLTPEEFSELKADIAARGVMVAVEYDEEGNILDGHHRVRICQELGIRDWPRSIRPYANETAKRTQARALNLLRRQMDTATKRHLIEQELRENPARSNNAIASDLGVDDKTVGAARDRLTSRSEIPNVSTVTDTLGRTQPISKPSRPLFIDTQRHHDKASEVFEAARAEPEKFSKLKDSMMRNRRVIGAHQRLDVMRRAEALRLAPPPLPRGPFPVIVADPPWKYDLRSEDLSCRGSAAGKYPTMTMEEICAVRTGDLAAKDCILWLWTTNAFMRDAFDVLDAWGFEHKTILTWAKDRVGVGDWLRGQTEHCLVAVRGAPHKILTTQTTLLNAPARGHSRKPDAFFPLVQSLCPAPPGGYARSGTRIRYRLEEIARFVAAGENISDD